MGARRKNIATVFEIERVGRAQKNVATVIENDLRESGCVIKGFLLYNIQPPYYYPPQKPIAVESCLPYA